MIEKLYQMCKCGDQKQSHKILGGVIRDCLKCTDCRGFRALPPTKDSRKSRAKATVLPKGMNRAFLKFKKDLEKDMEVDHMFESDALRILVSASLKRMGYKWKEGE